MKQLLLRGQVYLDAVIAVAFLLFWSVAEAGRHQLVPGTRSIEAPWWAALTLTAVAIALCRRFPVWAMGVTIATLVGQLLFPSAVFTDSSVAAYGGFLLIIAGVSASVPPRLRVLSIGFAVFVAAGVSGLLCRSWWSDSWPSQMRFYDDAGTVVGNRIAIVSGCVVLVAVAWFLGFLARVWQQKLQDDRILATTTRELQRAEVDLLVSSERDRIAQDVHDIMAHSLSVIIAQADGARFVAARRPEAVTGSLESIATSARTSLTEVRMLIESLVSDPVGHSNPALADIDELIERMRAAGLEATVERFGDAAPLTATQELAAYRIVQEGLTNALKHAGPAATARVVFDWRGTGLALTIASNGDGDGADAEPTTRGRGVYGMRERARLAGGWLTAGPDDEDSTGYLVTAYLPTELVAAGA
ncbi:sensor histidine kinase [Leifsonia poae]|uniref:sensor histidine kinase n=1 Tax=Leifsonia poae TaxID=110933 RepID=UPI001CC0BDB0|nr:histidine kinase [Leifsonia poae]